MQLICQKRQIPKLFYSACWMVGFNFGLVIPLEVNNIIQKILILSLSYPLFVIPISPLIVVPEYFCLSFPACPFPVFPAIPLPVVPADFRRESSPFQLTVGVFTDSAINEKSVGENSNTQLNGSTVQFETHLSS